MTTDITELAQRMSIERIKQIALGGTPTMGEKERLAITALYFSEQLKIATDAFQAAGLAQLAAEEALEKAQQRIDELENDEVRQRLASAEHQLYMAELAKHNLKASRKAQFRKRRADENRIAELESSSVTVKQYDEFQICHYGATEDYAKGYIDCQNNFFKWLTAAGIKWEAE